MTNEVFVEDSDDNFTEVKIITSPSFPAIVYEMEDLIARGWRVNQELVPNHNFTFYEVVLYKNAATIHRVKERIDKVDAGIAPMTADKRRENMAKARAKLAEKRAQEGGNES